MQSIQNLWRGSWGYSDGPTFNSTHLLPVDVDLSPNAINSKLRITPSGHGFDNNVNCAEFCIRDYTVDINGAHVFTQAMWRDDCGLNPIYPQGGTWIYDRANWCPGGKAWAYEHELTSYVTPGSTVNFDMDIEEYTWTGNQAPSYIIDAQLVTYGSPNFTHDAAILDIIAPNNHEEHGRRNPTVSYTHLTLPTSVMG